MLLPHEKLEYIALNHDNTFTYKPYIWILSKESMTVSNSYVCIKVKPEFDDEDDIESFPIGIPASIFVEARKSNNYSISIKQKDKLFKLPDGRSYPMADEQCPYTQEIFDKVMDVKEPTVKFALNTTLLNQIAKTLNASKTRFAHSRVDNVMINLVIEDGKVSIAPLEISLVDNAKEDTKAIIMPVKTE